MHIPLTPEANLEILLVFPNAKTFRVKEISRTRPAPQPGRWSCRGHEQYRHCEAQLVSSSLHCRMDGIAGAFVEIGSGNRIFLFPGNPSDFLSWTYPTDRTRPVSARPASS
jgi:hypothetical protein